MRPDATWTAFLMMCFAVVGLTGLFATFATSIPLEHGMARLAVLDQVLAAARQPDAATRLPALRLDLARSLGTIEADAVLSGPGDLFDRVSAARQTVLSETGRESRSVTYRTRVMVGIVTLMGALVGAGIMALSRRGAAQARAGALGT